MTTSYEPNACPACASTAAERFATAESMRDEVEALWKHHLRRLRPGTPPEHLYDRVAFSQRPPLGIARCLACGVLYRDPVERAREVEETYAAESVERAVLRSLRESQTSFYRERAQRLTDFAGTPGRGIEVGSYVGAFLAAAAEQGWSFHGIDVNESANAFVRETGGVVEEGRLEDSDAEPQLDALAIWNCFEQLPRPTETLQAARRRLRTGGVIVLRVPNGAFYAALRPLLSRRSAPIARELLATNNLLGFPYRNGYTPAALEAMLGRAGFSGIHVVPDVLVPTSDGWTRRWAAIEERVLKAAHRPIARWTRAPWVEVYARAA